VKRPVALGGGHGLSVSLGALRQLGVEPAAVVTMADDGGSSGRLRRDLGLPPPWPIRAPISASCSATGSSAATWPGTTSAT
jgi:uncharacterized cofD-like protein